jgi:hypothetical protein
VFFIHSFHLLLYMRVDPTRGRSVKRHEFGLRGHQAGAAAVAFAGVVVVAGLVMWSLNFVL